MEWIRCTVCEIFAFQLFCDLLLGFGVTQGHRKWHYSIKHIRLLFVFHSYCASIYYRFRDIAAHWSKIAIPPCIWRPRWGWRPQIYAMILGDEKQEWWAYHTVKEFRWYAQPFWHNTRVWQTDGQTELAWHIRAIAYAVARKKTFVNMIKTLPSFLLAFYVQPVDIITDINCIIVMLWCCIML